MLIVFLSFGGTNTGQVGGIWLSFEAAYLDTTGAAIGTLMSLIGEDDDSSVVFSGDFSFASKVSLDNDAACASDGADRRIKEENIVTDTTMLRPVMASGIVDADDDNDQTTESNGKYLCIHVDPNAEMPTSSIPSTGKYMVTTAYAGVEGTAFPPVGGTFDLGYIRRDGTTVHIPYITQYASYNQRIVVVNRGASEAKYEMSFMTEPGVTATSGSEAEGSAGS